MLLSVTNPFMCNGSLITSRRLPIGHKWVNLSPENGILQYPVRYFFCARHFTPFRNFVILMCNSGVLYMRNYYLIIYVYAYFISVKVLNCVYYLWLTIVNNLLYWHAKYIIIIKCHLAKVTTILNLLHSYERYLFAKIIETCIIKKKPADSMKSSDYENTRLEIPDSASSPPSP